MLTDWQIFTKFSVFPVEEGTLSASVLFGFTVFFTDTDDFFTDTDDFFKWIAILSSISKIKKFLF